MVPIYFAELAEVLHPAAAGHLRHTNHALAKKVLAFDGPRLAALSAFFFQALAGKASDPAGATRA